MSLGPLVFVAVLVLQAIILLWPRNADATGDEIVRRHDLRMFGGGEGGTFLPSTDRGRRILATVELVAAAAIVVAMVVTAAT